MNIGLMLFATIVSLTANVKWKGALSMIKYKYSYVVSQLVRHDNLGGYCGCA
jgi:hypothetical protein